MSIESMIPSNHLILCRPLLPSIFPSTRALSNESALCIRWPKYYSFSISPSSQCSGLISFRMDLFDPLAVPGTLLSFLQHHSLKESILWCSAFFMVQLSHPYMTTGKTSFHISLLKLTSSQAGAVSYSSVFAWLIIAPGTYTCLIIICWWNAFIMHQGPQSYLSQIPPLDLTF